MQEQDHLVVLFADISESTRIYDVLGNDTAQALVSRCLAILGEVVERYRGQVVKSIGDELMCVFPNAVEATRAAGDMHSRVREVSPPDEKLPFGRVRLKVGLHYGRVLVETGDVFGETVNVAARMAKLAKPDQIVTTEPTVWKLPEGLRALRWDDLEPAFAYQAKKKILAKLRGSESNLTAEDHFQLGVFLAMRNRHSAAVGEFRKAKTLDPDMKDRIQQAWRDVRRTKERNLKRRKK